MYKFLYFSILLQMRLRLRVLPGCAAEHNAVFNSTQQAPPGYAVHKSWLKNGFQGIQCSWYHLTKNPPSHSSMALHQTLPLHTKWRELRSPEAAIGSGLPLSICGHWSGLSAPHLRTPSQLPQYHHSHGHPNPTVLSFTPQVSTCRHHLPTP